MAGRTDSTRRLFLLLVVFVLGAGVLVARLGYWQIAQRQQLVDSARRQIYYQAPVPSKRGQIYDRSGTVVLAASVVRDRLIVSAANLNDQSRERMVSFLTTQLDLDPAGIASVRAKLETRKQYLVIARDLPPELTEAISDAAATAGIGGITIESDSIRSYPQPGGSPSSSLAATLIGFVNHEGAGQYGVEQYYQDVLAGQPKVVEADRDASGKPIMETERTIDPGVPGEDIRLTIDAGLQLAVEQEVMAARLANSAKSVSAVVLDPWTGEIYAEATYPSYDANDYGAVATNDDTVFQDPVVSQVYEPGSVFKMFTVIAGLETGTTTLHTVYKDTGRMKLDNGKTKVTDADGKAMGNMQLQDGIAYSRNVVASKVALGLAPTTTGAATILHEVWTRFGFGTATGIDVAGEVRGLVTDPAQRTWRQIDLANGSFGQGVAVTQIQLAAAYAAMVNGGTLVQPHVVAGVGSQAIATTGKPGLIDASLSPTLSGLMQHVLASPWYVDKSQVPGYWIGGKTGTAQVWDSAQNRWLHNVFNFSCVGFIGRTEGHPDLIVAVKIQEAVPARNAQGQLVLPIVSTELFRRVATDAITTPGLLAPLDSSTTTSGTSGRAGE
ncbi:MAG TPA: penicillin-binding protein 2 [Candidatus Limnocylindrales bacterium]|nr:penicillin-binding protein 2 [Candidatus Limnocylindrales bacterium]